MSQAAKSPHRGKSRSIYVVAEAEAEALAGGQMTRAEGYQLYKYPDYETYRAVQTNGNKAKITRQFVQESHIRALSAVIADMLGHVGFGLCHGTRRGAEQAWFAKHLPGNPDVIGTEISDTATEFPNTVQWDFHDENPLWSDRADFIYSNSWDHAFDPTKAFGSWIKSLKPGGLMLLDHSRAHSPAGSSALDPFGITLERLETLLATEFADEGAVLPTIESTRHNPEYAVSVVVFQKNG